MTRASNNEFSSILFDEQASDVSTPATGFWRAFFKSDGLYVIDDAGVVSGPLGAGGGWPPSFPSAPTIVESVDWTVTTSAAQAISLASTPSTGDVIFMAQTGNQYDAILPSGGGATWSLVVAGETWAGAILPVYLWMGIVGGSPATGCTANWAGHNAEAVALMNVRGLDGVVEAHTARTVGVPQAASTLGVGPLHPVLSPICIAVASHRTTNALTIGGGFTVAEGANVGPGYNSLAYKMTSQLENVAPTWAFQTANAVMLAALVY